MTKWIGHANDVERTKFNVTVAERMAEFGWNAKREVTVNEILGRSLDRNYGDIDVLAWRPGSNRVLAIECKDLQFLKTLGEVAEQLSDFRGEKNSAGKPDHLRRHLDRLAILQANEQALSAFLKISMPLRVEGHLVFKNLVPMQFAWKQMAERIKLSLFEELDRI